MSADTPEPADRRASRLLDMFPPASAAEWRRLVESELHGAPFERLVTRTLSGIELQPIYWPEDIAQLPFLESPPGAAPFLRGPRAARPEGLPWLICQSIRAADAAAANALARAAVAHGAAALELALEQPAMLAPTLAGIQPGAIAIFLETTPGQALEYAGALVSLAPGTALSGGLGADPLAAGEHSGAREQRYDEIAALTRWGAEHAPQLSTLLIDGAPYHEAGGSALEELAFALAAGVEQLRALGERGVEAALAGPRARLVFAVGTELFMEIAKLRAARLLWARAVAAFGAPPEAGRASIHARSARRSQTVADAHGNLLRGTAAAFAAAAGGCDSLEIAPFDAALGEQGALGRRLALNTQHLLAEESQLGLVIDPAGGSWFVEALTDALARKSWALFQEVEQRGGMARALEDGFPQQRSSAVAARRAASLATRRSVLVGTNWYANPEEALPAEAPAAPAPGPLAPQRDAAPFEALRRRAEAGGQPQAFLANMGTRAQHRTRADFATSFLQVGGFTVLDSPGFAVPEQAARAAIESGAAVVVICGQDQQYPEVVAPLVAALRASRPEAVCVLAGYPEEQVEAHRAAGIDYFIHLRADLVATLGDILGRLGR